MTLISFPILSLLLGFLFLYIGGEFLVKGAISISARLKISRLIIGMTVVSFATSLPEVFVSIQALMDGSSNIAFGNVFGSNIANITLVLGVTAIIARLDISKQIISINYPFLLFISLLVGVLLFYFGKITFFIGVIFILLLLMFLFFLIVIKKNDESELSLAENRLSENSFQMSSFRGLLFFVIGVLLLRYGSDSLVNGTIQIAKYFGVSDRIIAVTIVAFGTSIPELVTSIIAALRKEQNLAIGNLIGSNIFNILAVLGISATVKDIIIDDIAIFNFDYLYMILATILVGLFIYFSSKRKISKIVGWILVILYFMYIYLNIVI